MKIAICASMVFTEKMLEIKKELENLGHEVFVSGFADTYVGKTEREIEKLKLHHIKKSDAILVLDYDRKGVKNYIGGNTLMEIGFAHVLNKKVFLMNPVPEIEFYKSEIEAAKPVVINGDLSKIK